MTRCATILAVRRITRYGRKSLYVGGHATGIVGWPEGRALAFLAENSTPSRRRSISPMSTNGGRATW